MKIGIIEHFFLFSHEAGKPNIQSKLLQWSKTICGKLGSGIESIFSVICFIALMEKTTTLSFRYTWQEMCLQPRTTKALRRQ